MFPSPSLNSRRIQTVSELTSSITVLMESEFPFVAISGEISNVRRPYSGHCYFTLKDDQAQIRCVLFKGQQRYLQQPLTDGARVICRGRISVYKQRGEYQIIVDHVADEGVGRLQQQFDRLKEKLLTEGLFAPEAKKKLPLFVGKVCLITSPSGAAVHDFLRKALERFSELEVEILPVAVQGEKAAQEIAEQIATANRRGWADVIVLTRGGGSLEDLAAFNDELLARAIHASGIPLVAAIGHEVDFTIADFVADHRSPTPTAAAEEIILAKDEIVATLDRLQKKMTRAWGSIWQDKTHRLAMATRHLADPRTIIDHYRLKVDHVSLNLTHSFTALHGGASRRLEACLYRLTSQAPQYQISAGKTRCLVLASRLRQQMKTLLDKKRGEVARQAAQLDALSPLAVLARGYALAFTSQKDLIRNVGQVEKGEEITVRVGDGAVTAKVRQTKKNK